MGNIKPFVGISGVTTVKEVRDLARIYNQYGFDSRTIKSHEPQISIFLSEQGLDRKRRGEQAGARFAAYDNVHLMVRACRDFGIVPSISFITRERRILYENIMRVFGEENIYRSCRRLQLQVISPGVDEKYLGQVERIKERLPKVELSLSFARAAINQGDAVKHAHSYAGLANRIMIDFSCGREYVPIDKDRTARYFIALRQRIPGIGVGCAGCLDGDNVGGVIQGIAEILDWNYNISVDALRGVRDKIDDIHGNDVLNIAKAEKFVSSSSESLGQRRA